MTLKIKIIPRPDDEHAVRYAQDLGRKLQRDGHVVWFEDGNNLNASLNLSPRTDSDADIAVVIGGDGSVLHAVQTMHPQIPLVGINFGRVGFLADLESDEAYAFISQLKPETIETESRMRVQIAVDDKIYNCALNEAVIVTERPAKMLQFSVIVDGIPVETFRSDGLIISTPTGSTAYALAAGGPILPPEIRNILLMPVAPHLSIDRAVVLSEGASVFIRVKTKHEAVVSVDGQKPVHLSSGDGVKIIAHEKSLTMVRFEDPGYFYRNLTVHMEHNPLFGKRINGK